MLVLAVCTDHTRRRRLARGHDELRHVEADVGHAAVVDGALDVIEVARIDLDEGGDLVRLRAARTERRALFQEIGQHLLLIAARALRRHCADCSRRPGS